MVTPQAGNCPLAPYEVRYGTRAVFNGEVELERHEILHYIRGQREETHRLTLWAMQFRQPYEMGDLAQLCPSLIHDFRNKTVPIYILKSNTVGQVLILMVLQNYLYRRWFSPYRTDIEYDQFIAKVLYCSKQPDTQGEEAAVDLAMSMHNTICLRLDNTVPYSEPLLEQYYEIRPLFRAIAIIIQGKDYPSCAAVSRVAEISVLIILTGQTDGLSAPITFDSIADGAEILTLGGKTAARTSLGTAIGFVMGLEEREDAAFGPKPDPVASTARGEIAEALYEHQQFTAEKLGWGEQRLTGPSSKWVSLIRYPKWTGNGALADSGMMAWWERKEYRSHAFHCRCHESEAGSGYGRRTSGTGSQEPSDPYSRAVPAVDFLPPTILGHYQELTFNSG
ncbi:hypothetical protein ACJZ2D_011764 [Fusarium nematophilum]